MPASTTNVKVFVEWDEAAVYAGEDVKCKITFKNVASPANSDGTMETSSTTNRSAAEGTERRTVPARPKASRASSKSNVPRAPRAQAAPLRVHQQSLSLNAPRARNPNQADSGPALAQANYAAARGHSHQRSVSIISLGAGETGVVQNQGPTASRTIQRPGRPHTRAASLQIVPKRSGVANGGWSFLQQLSQIHMSLI